MEPPYSPRRGARQSYRLEEKRLGWRRGVCREESWSCPTYDLREVDIWSWIKGILPSFSLLTFFPCSFSFRFFFFFRFSTFLSPFFVFPNFHPLLWYHFHYTDFISSSSPSFSSSPHSNLFPSSVVSHELARPERNLPGQNETEGGLYPTVAISFFTPSLQLLHLPQSGSCNEMQHFKS